MNKWIALRIIAPCLILQIFVLGQSALASPFGFSESLLSTYFEGDYFSTTQNYNDSGTISNLPAGNSLTEIKGSLYGSYDFTNRWSVYGRASFVSQDAVTSLSEKSNSGFSDVTFGAQYLLTSGQINIVPDLSVTVPTYPSDGSDGAALLGEGATLATGRIHLSKAFRKIALAAYSGAQFRSNGLSLQVPWGVFSQVDIKRFFIEALLVGSISLSDDANLASPQIRRSVTSRLMAGSLLYDSINPSWTHTIGRVGYRIDSDFFINIGVEQSLFGIRSPVGTAFMVGLGYQPKLNGARRDDSEVDRFRPNLETDEGPSGSSSDGPSRGQRPSRKTISRKRIPIIVPY